MEAAQLVNLISRQHELSMVKVKHAAGMQDSERELSNNTRDIGRAYSIAQRQAVWLAELDDIKTFLDSLIPINLLMTRPGGHKGQWTWIEVASEVWQSWETLADYAARPAVLENLRTSWRRVGGVNVVGAGVLPASLVLNTQSCTCEEWDAARDSNAGALAKAETEVGEAFARAVSAAMGAEQRQAALTLTLQRAQESYRATEAEMAGNAAEISRLKRELKLPDHAL